MTPSLSSALDFLQDNLDDIAGDITGALVNAIPSFERMPADLHSSLCKGSRDTCGVMMHCLRGEGVTVDSLQWEDLRGFELGDILRALQIGGEVIWKWVEQAREETGFSAQEALHVAEVLWEFNMTAVRSAVQAYMKQYEEFMAEYNGLLNRVRMIQDRDKLVKRVAEGVCTGLGYRRAVFFLFEQDLLVPLTAHDQLDPFWGDKVLEDKKQYPLSPVVGTLEARAFYEPAIKVARAKKGKMIAYLSPEEGAFFALVPVNPAGSLKGLLYVEADVSHGVIAGRDLELLRSYADMVGMALENTRLYREILSKRKAMDHLMSRVNTAHEEERARIARELHDSVAQSLLKIIYSAGFALDFLKEDPQLVVEEIEEVQLRAKGCLRELRAIMANLRPTSLDILGLKETVLRYAEQFEEEYAISTSVDLQGLDSVPPSVELTVFRILQEELTNVRKHSNAESVKIRSVTSEDDLVLVVEDDGIGFDPEMVAAEQERGNHLGLMAMRERTELLGGDFIVDSVPGMGTRITVRLPVIAGGER